MATIHSQHPNGMHNTTTTNNNPPPTYQLSIPMPAAPPTSAIHIRLTLLSSTTLLLFLTSTTGDSTAASSGTTLGSFVYAMPDRLDPSNPALSTPLYTLPSSHDFSTRMAKILARKTNRACYVSSSVNFAPGATVEEEMKGFRDVLDVVVGVCAGA